MHILYPHDLYQDEGMTLRADVSKWNSLRALHPDTQGVYLPYEENHGVHLICPSWMPLHAKPGTAHLPRRSVHLWFIAAEDSFLRSCHCPELRCLSFSAGHPGTPLCSCGHSDSSCPASQWPVLLQLIQHLPLPHHPWMHVSPSRLNFPTGLMVSPQTLLGDLPSQALQ